MVGSAGTPRDAASEHASRVRDAITYTRRVSREASAVHERLRSENAELVAEFRARRLAGNATDATPTRMKEAAKNFRVAAGLPVHDLPDAADLVPLKRRSRPQVAPKSEEDEDFSQARIMVRGD